MSDHFREYGVPGVGETETLNSIGLREWLRGNMRDSVTDGVALYKELFCCDEQYYVLAKELKLTAHENKLLAKNALKILQEVPAEGPLTIIDMGGVAVEKNSTIIDALEKSGRKCRYFVASYCCLSVIRAVANINKGRKYVQASGIYGSAIQILNWAKQHVHGPLLFISLGSCITNYEPSVQRFYLDEWNRISSGMILGQDAPCNSEAAGESIANYKQMKKFLRYGMWRCLALLPHPTLLEKHWILSCEIKNRPLRHSWFLQAPTDFKSWAGTIWKDHKIEMYTAHKYTEREMRDAFHEEGLKLVRTFKHTDQDLPPSK